MSPSETEPREAAGLFLEALRLDRRPLEAERERALGALEAGAGGFLLFGGEAGEVRDLAAELRRLAGRPLWMAADLERGAGQQFAGATELPPPAALAAHPRAREAVRRAARITAREARSLGINWVLAPVLDLDVEPRNPIVGTRSFGADPDEVAGLGEAWIEACQAEGVAACAKHFPGHGRTTADSHLELPVVAVDRATLEADLRPFRRVAGSVASVMTAHVAYPALGAEGPATLSRRALTGLLRGELGFAGLVATDALVMAGAGEPAAAPARAVAAGCDLLLYPERLEEAARALAAAAGREPGVAEAVRRALDRSRRGLVRWAEASGPGGFAGARERETAGDLGPGAAGEEALGMAVACLGAEAGAAAAGWARGRPVEVWSLAHATPDALGAGEPRGPDRPPPGAALAAELRALGWRARGPRALGPDVLDARGARPGDPDVAGGVAGGAAEADGTPARVVVVDAVARGWRGWALLPPDRLERIGRALAGPGPRLAVVCGGRRVAEQVGRRLERAADGGGEAGAAVLCAWWTGSLMERAAARWLDARAA